MSEIRVSYINQPGTSFHATEPRSSLRVVHRNTRAQATDLLYRPKLSGRWWCVAHVHPKKRKQKSEVRERLGRTVRPEQRRSPPSSIFFFFAVKAQRPSVEDRRRALWRWVCRRASWWEMSSICRRLAPSAAARKQFSSVHGGRRTYHGRSLAAVPAQQVGKALKGLLRSPRIPRLQPTSEWWPPRMFVLRVVPVHASGPYLPRSRTGLN